jgi:uncharacterized membrane protein (DUF485 family)
MALFKRWLDRFTSSETMAVILVVWLCSLIAIGLIVTPLFGAKVAGTVALALLVALLVLCWGLCLSGRSHWHR